jgi:hypothetical protein
VRFFLDNCLSPYHAKGLRGFAEIQGNEIVHLRQRFDDDAADVEWIAELGSEGDWIIISGDTRITRSPIEKAAWHESNLTAFFFSEPFPSDSFWKQAHSLVGWWPTIVLQARRTPQRHGFVMPKVGRELKRIYP